MDENNIEEQLRKNSVEQWHEEERKGAQNSRRIETRNDPQSIRKRKLDEAKSGKVAVKKGKVSKSTKAKRRRKNTSISTSSSTQTSKLTSSTRIKNTSNEVEVSEDKGTKLNLNNFANNNFSAQDIVASMRAGTSGYRNISENATMTVNFLNDGSINANVEDEKENENTQENSKQVQEPNNERVTSEELEKRKRQSGSSDAPENPIESFENENNFIYQNSIINVNWQNDKNSDNLNVKFDDIKENRISELENNAPNENVTSKLFQDTRPRTTFNVGNDYSQINNFDDSNDQDNTQSPEDSGQEDSDNGMDNGGNVNPRAKKKKSLNRLLGRKSKTYKRWLKRFLKRYLIIFILTGIFFVAIVGMLSFFINMPGSVMHYLKEWADEVWTELYGYVKGKDIVSNKEINSLARYLDTMGYDLELWGFATEYEYDEKSKNVEELKTKYLPTYLAAEHRDYMISNQTETISIASLFNAANNFFSGNEFELGTGTVRIERNALDILQIKFDSLSNYLLELQTKVSLLRREKELLLTRQSLSFGTQIGGKEVYRFKLKHWLEKYSTPVEFYIALHLASGAPEYAFSMAENPSQGDAVPSTDGTTKIDVAVATLDPGTEAKLEIVYPDVDTKTRKVKIDENGNVKFLTIKEIEEKISAGEEVYGLSNLPNLQEMLAAAKRFNENSMVVFTPYITKVINHWFYKEVIYQGTPSEGEYAGKEIDVYEKQKLETPYNRYYMYTSIQTGSENNQVTAGNNQTGTAGNTNTATGTTGDTNTTAGTAGNANTATGTTDGNNTTIGNTATGTTGNSTSTNAGDTGIGFNSNEVSTGDDRKELEEISKLLASSGSVGSLFFGDGILGRLLNIVANKFGINATYGGIIGIFTGVSRDLLAGTFLEIGGYTVSLMANYALANVENEWARGLCAYFATGEVMSGIAMTEAGKYVGYTNLNVAMGLVPSVFQNVTVQELAAFGVISPSVVTIGFSDIKNIEELPGKLADSVSFDNLTNAANGVSNFVSNMVSEGGYIDQVADTMVDAMSVDTLNVIADSMVQTANTIFSGVSLTQYAEMSALYIQGVAESIAKNVTNAFSQDWINFNMNFDAHNALGNTIKDMAVTIMQNEVYGQITSLTKEQMDGLAGITTLDLQTLQELKAQLDAISETVNEAIDAADEMTELVNEDVLDYAEMDAQVMCNIAKKIETAILSIDDTKKALSSLKNAWESSQSNITSFLYYQVNTKIDEANEAINNLVKDIKILNLSNIQEYAEELYEAAYNIQRLIAEHDGKISDAVDAVVLKTLSTPAVESSMEVAQAFLDIDINTLQKYKSKWPEATLEIFLLDASKVQNLSPALSGMDQKLEALDGKLEDLTIGNMDEVLSILATYSGELSEIEWLSDKKIEAIQKKIDKMIEEINNSKRTLNNSTNQYLLGQISLQASGILGQNIANLATQTVNLPNMLISDLNSKINTYINGAISDVNSLIYQQVNKLAHDISQAIFASVTESFSATLSDKLNIALSDKLNSNSSLKNAMTTRNANHNQQIVEPEDGSEDHILSGTTTEQLTGWYIKETRYNDYMQKAEPVLVPYNSEHWIKMFLEEKYLIAGTEEYEALRKQYGETENLFENKELVEKYGKSIWEASSGIFEETVCALLQSSDDVDTQYILRYFKELFAEYGDAIQKKYNEMRLDSNSATTTTNNKIKDDTIGWLFEIEKKTETINTQTGLTVEVEKAKYEPVYWGTQKGILSSKTTDAAVGFDAGLNIISPANAKIISKTTAGKNEFNQTIPSSLILELTNTGDTNADGIRIVITGGDYSQVNVGSTVTKGQVIGVTSNIDMSVSVLEKGTHTLATDVSKYIKLPSMTSSFER